MIFPFLAVIFNVIDVIKEKSIFSRKRKRYRIFVPFIFLFSFLIISIFLFPFLGKIDPEGLKIIPLLILGLVIIIAAIRNMMYYSGFYREGLSEIEPFVVFTPLLTILIASIFYPDERNWGIIILAVVASLALIFSHVEKKHLKIDKGIIPIMGAIVFESIENNLIKELLYYYSPVAMYTVRVGLVALLLFIFLKPQVRDLSKKEIKNLFFVGLMWVLVMIFVYYGYQTVGIVYTFLVLMLAPVLIVFGSYVFLRERKIKRKDIIALIIVMFCVILSQFIR